MTTQTTIERPAEFTGAVSPGLAAQQRAARKAAQRVLKLRQKASAEIDRLIAFMDACDPYVMTELEPNLGFPEGMLGGGDIEDGQVGDTDDRELDEAEREPSLGSFDRMTDQSKSWRRGGLWEVPEIDAEHDTADIEPSLGFLERHPTLYGEGRDQSGSQLEPLLAAGLGGDREDEHDGSEPEDEGEDGADDEPSLGSFDRMMDQSSSWRQTENGQWCAPGVDAELSEERSRPSGS